MQQQVTDMQTQMIEMQHELRNMHLKSLAMQREIIEMHKETLSLQRETRDMQNNLWTMMDEVVTIIKKRDQMDALQGGTLTRHEETLIDHNRRICTLEEAEMN